MVKLSFKHTGPIFLKENVFSKMQFKFNRPILTQSIEF